MSKDKAIPPRYVAWWETGDIIESILTAEDLSATTGYAPGSEYIAGLLRRIPELGPRQVIVSSTMLGRRGKKGCVKVRLSLAREEVEP